MGICERAAMTVCPIHADLTPRRRNHYNELVALSGRSGSCFEVLLID